jgi:hypothetical protein
MPRRTAMHRSPPSVTVRLLAAFASANERRVQAQPIAPLTDREEIAMRAYETGRMKS